MWNLLKMHAFIVSVLLCNVFMIGGEPAHNDVTVVEGYEADIPCVTSPNTNSSRYGELPTKRPQLIIWYKDGVKSSIYSYDGRDPDNERHWSSRRTLGGALTLNLPASPLTRPQLAFLSIGHAHETDAGVYNCRVDFREGPGRRTYTKLIVVSPPSTPTVEVWAEGRWLHTTHETSTATVEVGTKLSLRCYTSGGSPSPSLTWWRGGQQLLAETTAEGDIVSSWVNVTVVDQDAHTPIVCQASNTHLIPPLRTPLLLLVLSPPKWIRVIGADIQMSAGRNYVIECRCVGARPPPVITWFVGGDELTEATSTTDAEGETTSRLRFTPKPAHFGTHITCKAHPPEHAELAVSPHATPTLWVKSDSVPLKIHYKPEVKLKVQKMETRYTNRHKQIYGKETNDERSRPPPFSPSTARNQNASIKSSEHVRKQRVESAVNNDHEMEGNGIRDKGTTDIKDSVKKETRIGRKSSHSGSKGAEHEVTVDELSGVALQCNVRANPPAYHVSWHKNGIPLSPVTSPGLLLGNMSAVFPRVKRSDAGNMTCTAHNNEGSTRSNSVLLQVIHDPECARNTAKILGVPRHHTLNVTCEVEAYPLPTEFTWALKSSRGTLAVPSEMIHFSGKTSWISYTPRANVDFGDLLCWAHTEDTHQEDPCVAKLVSAEKPDTPEKCKVTKRSQDKITVECKAAHDGGLPQTFFMKAFHGSFQVANSTSVIPKITIYDLEPDTRYRLTIWSANTHGTSTGQTTLITSTLPVNSSSTTSSMNGHSSSHYPNGLLSKFGSSVLAVVVVVTVIGVIVGVIVGLMVQKIDTSDHHHRHPTEDDYEEGEERPPTLINNNQVNVAMAGIGRKVPKCLEPLGKSTTRYDLMTEPGAKSDNHVYDDPITLREECNLDENTHVEENVEVTHNIQYPSFTSAMPDLPHQYQNFSWHLPNSRLLRNQFNQRYQVTGGCPRKPVRVETPRLPELDVSTTITTHRKFQTPPGMEFRLILIPETSKMLQVAMDRDAKLASYLTQDSQVPSSAMKFPTITEEEEHKHLYDDPSVTPYESTPDDFTIENGQSDTELLPKQNYIMDNYIKKHNEIYNINQNLDSSGIYSHILPKKVLNNPLNDAKIVSQSKLTKVGDSDDIEGPLQTKRPLHPRRDKIQPIIRNLTNAKPLNIQRNSMPSLLNTERDVKRRVSLMETPQYGRKNITPKRARPSLPLVGKLGRHHLYDTPESNEKRDTENKSKHINSNRNEHPDNPTPAEKRIHKVNNSSINNSPANIPMSPFSLLRKPKVGVTSLLSLVSSSSSSASLTSSSSPIRRGQESRQSTISPICQSRRRSVAIGSIRKSPFRNLRTTRPRSFHHISGPEHIIHWWGDAGDGEDCPSASPPSSPRSSASSSSCFPYSSISSSPVSSFYSSDNSLSISAAFSPSSSSSSSYRFSSTSSSTASSSPFSSFLSPSLTNPSSTSVLSLSSCSATPDSVLSGNITPT